MSSGVVYVDLDKYLQQMLKGNRECDHFIQCKKSSIIYSAGLETKVVLGICHQRWIFKRNQELDGVLQTCVKLDGCFRHVIILIQVCKPDNCTWKQLIGQIFISFYLYRHSGEIGRTQYEYVPSALSTCTNTKQI